METEEIVCPCCKRKFMRPKFENPDREISLSLDWNPHNGSFYDHFVMCPNCEYIFIKQNPVFDLNVLHACWSPACRSIEKGELVLTTLYRAGYVMTQMNWPYLAGNAYLFAAWYAQEYDLDGVEDAMSAAANCFLTLFASDDFQDDASALEIPLILIDIYRKLQAFDEADAAAKTYLIGLEDSFSMSIQQRIAGDMEQRQYELNLLKHIAIAQYERMLIRKQDSSEHYYSEFKKEEK